MNIFATESQIDIMAAAAGVDPLAFRLNHIQDTRMRRVLQAAADAFGWSPAAGPSGRGYGIALSSDAGSFVATIAEVKVDKASGRVKVVRMVCAQDMGIIVNPEGARMQIEGGLTMGLGYTLTEELRFHGGEVLDRNFDTYHLPALQRRSENRGGVGPEQRARSARLRRACDHDRWRGNCQRGVRCNRR